MIDRLRKAGMDKLVASLECLCGHVGQLTNVIVDLTASIHGLAASNAAVNEQQRLLRGRLERIDGRLDRIELYAARNFGYPNTQVEMPDLDELRAWIATGRKDR